MEDDIFGFANFHPEMDQAPPLLRFKARDGAELSYRFYESQNKEKVIFLIHGSSADGRYLHQFANYLSLKNSGDVYVPNLRGHYQSGDVQGDCAYPNQLEEDLADLIEHEELTLRKKFLIGHSSGGSFAMRFAGGQYGHLIEGFVLLSPSIPLSKAVRSLDAEGWASFSLFKLSLIKLLNLFHLTFLNHQKVITFNKPAKYCDGTETLEYSYNLLTASQPHDFYKKDVAALAKRFILICGAEDEIHNPKFFPSVMNDPKGDYIYILKGVNHINLVLEPRMMEIAAQWISSR